MLLGVVSGVGRGMGVLDRGGDRRSGRGIFGDEFEAFHCNRWDCCVVVRERRALPKLLWEDLFMASFSLWCNMLTVLGRPGPHRRCGKVRSHRMRCVAVPHSASHVNVLLQDAGQRVAPHGTATHPV